jgi:putative DNA primase/helicase
MNGKSALFALLRDILGPFYLTAHKDLYIQTNSHHSSAGAPEPHKVALKGKRLAVLEETKQEDKLDINSIKQFVQDIPMYISARDLYGPSKKMVFRVFAKHCILTNNILRFRSEPGDKGGTDRLTTIPFDMRFTTDPREIEKELAQGKYCKLADRNTVEALRTIHLSQVFSFFVKGAMAWYRNNQCLPCPKEVIDATEGTKADGDWVQQFIDQCCETGIGDDFYVVRSQLYAAYGVWWGENIQEQSGMETQTRFRAILVKSKGFRGGDNDRKSVNKKQEHVYFGLKIKLA